MLIFVKLWRWWRLTFMEFSRWLLVVLLEVLNGNLFFCVGGRHHRSALFYSAFIVLLLMCTHSYYSFIVHLICYAFLAHLFLLFFCCTHTCYYCASIGHFFLLCLSYMHTYSCYTHVTHLFLLCMHLFLLCMHLFLLCCSLSFKPLGMLLNFWPSYIVVLNYCLTFDLFTLFPFVPF